MRQGEAGQGSQATQLRQRNRRTALILLSVAVVFALGAMARQWLFGH